MFLTYKSSDKNGKTKEVSDKLPDDDFFAKKLGANVAMCYICIRNLRNVFCFYKCSKFIVSVLNKGPPFPGGLIYFAVTVIFSARLVRGVIL